MLMLFRSPKFCPACARPIRSVWAGWKRSCIPGELSGQGTTAEPACVSRKGVHNFSYPRTDPVVIMAVLSPDRERILLGRQRSWPARFYSCLAGFVESGESLEEAVRREVYEEAGIVIGEVGYHSSQPWPFPASLMFGCWGIAESASAEQNVRVDLDNELEDARFFSREQVLQVINSTKPMQLSREQVAKLDGKGAQDKETGAEAAKRKADDEGSFLMPPACVASFLAFKCERLGVDSCTGDTQDGYRQHARDSVGDREALQPAPGRRPGLQQRVQDVISLGYIVNFFPLNAHSPPAASVESIENSSY